MTCGKLSWGTLLEFFFLFFHLPLSSNMTVLYRIILYMEPQRLHKSSFKELPPKRKGTQIRDLPCKCSQDRAHGHAEPGERAGVRGLVTSTAFLCSLLCAFALGAVL